MNIDCNFGKLRSPLLKKVHCHVLLFLKTVNFLQHRISIDCCPFYMKPSFPFFIPAIIWFLLSFYLLTLPGTAFPTRDWFNTLQVDKWVHILLFGVLVMLFYHPFKPNWKTKSFKSIAVLMAIAALAYGVAMEFVQKKYIPYRSFDEWDIVADGIGSFLPLAIMRWKKKV